MNCPARCERLIALASATPAATSRLTFDTRLEHLREGDLWRAYVSTGRFGKGVDELVDKGRAGARVLAAAVHAADRCSGGSR